MSLVCPAETCPRLLTPCLVSEICSERGLINHMCKQTMQIVLLLFVLSEGFKNV